MTSIDMNNRRSVSRRAGGIAWASRNSLVVTLLAIFAVAPLVFPTFVVSELTRALIYGLAAASVGFLVGRVGLVSFGHSAYFGIGAYTVLVAHLNGMNEALVVWPAAVLLSSLAGCIFGALALPIALASACPIRPRRQGSRSLKVPLIAPLTRAGVFLFD